MMQTLTSKLAEFALNAKPSDQALAVLQLSYLDWLSVALAGQDEPVAHAVHSLALEEGGASQAFMFGSRQKVPPRMAAMVNGTIGHALDFDDTHFAHIGHPSAVILPAVLAVGQSRAIDGSAIQPLCGQADQIEQIIVQTNPRWLRVCNIEAPKDGLETKFSYRHVLAMSAHGQDTAGSASYTQASAVDPRLTAFRDKVDVIGDAAIEETATVLTVHLKNGSSEVFEHDLNAAIPLNEKSKRIAAKSSALIGFEKSERLKALIEAQASADEIATACSN